MFSIFKDDKGQFMESLQTDVKGLLNLYEASFMAFDGETLLDDAKSFAKKCLENVKQHIKSNLIIKQIDHTLELPWYRRTLRFESRLYIEFYARKEDAIGSLLNLAKLDFNIVQSALQRDLVQVLRYNLHTFCIILPSQQEEFSLFQKLKGLTIRVFSC